MGEERKRSKIMSISKDVFLFEKGFGVVTFSDENYKLAFDFVDDALQTGGDLTYTKSLSAPRAAIYFDEGEILSRLNFASALTSFENWENIKKCVDGMCQFFQEVLKEYADDFRDIGRTNTGKT